MFLNKIAILAPVSITIALTAVLNGCQNKSTITKAPELHQKWELQAGDRIADYEIISGLGDLSLELRGKAIYAPAKGKTTMDARHCIYFDSPEIPNYLFRLCGLQNPTTGSLQKGDEIGKAQQLQFATLRQHPSGKWAIVEPSKQILEKLLKSS
jgi:hypothetical protein